MPWNTRLPVPIVTINWNQVLGQLVKTASIAMGEKPLGLISKTGSSPEKKEPNHI